MTFPERFLAIDWSGARSASHQRKHIWIANASDEVELSAGLTRDQLCSKLIKEFSNEPAVIGLDFAFSLPASFLSQSAFGTVHDLWRATAIHGEEWLRACNPPFWGRPGKKCPSTHSQEGFRKTDREISVNGIAPKSPFQIGGAGAVGTGSIRGMPILDALHQAGFSIWPFDPPGLPMVVEIYPRLLTGEVTKSSPVERARYLRRYEFYRLQTGLIDSAEASEDAFDALISALKMREHANSLAQLQQAHDADERLEGRIWSPPLRSGTVL